MDTILESPLYRCLLDHRPVPLVVQPDLRRGQWLGVGSVHRLAGGPDPDLPDPALREADQVDAEHAGAPAEDEGDPGALQERQAAPVRRDDEAVQGDGYQPALLAACRSWPSRRSSSRCTSVLSHIAQGQAGRRHRPAAAGQRPAARTSSVRRWRRSSWTARRRSQSLGASLTDVRVVTVIMIVMMSASQFYTQRQLMTKNVDMTVKTPFMQQQKMLMYVFPLMFAVFGINFPVGVLVYWLTTNVWTMGQQMFVIRRNPTPGSLAFKQRQERLRAKGKLVEDPEEVEAKEAVEAARANRQQPKRQTKAKRQQAGGGPPAARSRRVRRGRTGSAARRTPARSGRRSRVAGRRRTRRAPRRPAAAGPASRRTPSPGSARASSAPSTRPRSKKESIRDGRQHHHGHRQRHRRP